MTENEIAGIVVDAAYYVHRKLGPGLLETVCEIILAHELKNRGLKVERQEIGVNQFWFRADSGRYLKGRQWSIIKNLA